MKIYETNNWRALILGDDLAAVEFPGDGVYNHKLQPVGIYFKLEQFAREVIKEEVKYLVPAELPGCKMPGDTRKQCSDAYLRHSGKSQQARTASTKSTREKKKRTADPDMEKLSLAVCVLLGTVRKKRDGYEVTMPVEHNNLPVEANLIISFHAGRMAYRPAGTGIKSVTRARLAFEMIQAELGIPRPRQKY